MVNRYVSTMEQDPELLDPTRVVGEQVARIRKARGWTQEALAEALQAAGIDLERITIAKLESGHRPFVKLDELLGLCLVLGVTPVDLLVPKEVEAGQWYQVTPKATAYAENVREWIQGLDLLFYRTDPERDEPDTPFDPSDLLNATRWMPADRAARAMQRWLEAQRQKEEDQDH